MERLQEATVRGNGLQEVPPFGPELTHLDLTGNHLTQYVPCYFLFFNFDVLFYLLFSFLPENALFYFLFPSLIPLFYFCFTFYFPTHSHSFHSNLTLGCW